MLTELSDLIDRVEDEVVRHTTVMAKDEDHWGQLLDLHLQDGNGEQHELSLTDIQQALGEGSLLDDVELVDLAENEQAALDEAREWYLNTADDAHEHDDEWMWTGKQQETESQADLKSSDPAAGDVAQKALWDERALFVKASLQLLEDRDLRSALIDAPIVRTGLLKKAIKARNNDSISWKTQRVQVRFGFLRYQSDGQGEWDQSEKIISLRACTVRAVKHHPTVQVIKQQAQQPFHSAIFELKVKGQPPRLWMAASKKERTAWIRAFVDASREGEGDADSGATEGGGGGKINALLGLGSHTKASSEYDVFAPDKYRVSAMRTQLQDASTQQQYLSVVSGIAQRPLRVPIAWVRKEIGASRPDEPVVGRVGQLWKDMRRDRVVINGREFLGEAGPESIVGALLRAILQCISNAPALSPLTTVLEFGALMVAREVLFACNRTQSGGDTYMCVNVLCGSPEVVLCPASAEAEPLTISLEYVAPQTHARAIIPHSPRYERSLTPPAGSLVEPKSFRDHLREPIRPHFSLLSPRIRAPAPNTPTSHQPPIPPPATPSSPAEVARPPLQPSSSEDYFHQELLDQQQPHPHLHQSHDRRHHDHDNYQQHSDQHSTLPNSDNPSSSPDHFESVPLARRRSVSDNNLQSLASPHERLGHGGGQGAESDRATPTSTRSGASVSFATDAGHTPAGGIRKRRSRKKIRRKSAGFLGLSPLSATANVPTFDELSERFTHTGGGGGGGASDLGAGDSGSPHGTGELPPSIKISVHAGTAFRVCTSNPQQGGAEDEWATVNGLWQQGYELVCPYADSPTPRQNVTVKQIPTRDGHPSAQLFSSGAIVTVSAAITTLPATPASPRPPSIPPASMGTVRVAAATARAGAGGAKATEALTDAHAAHGPMWLGKDLDSPVASPGSSRRTSPRASPTPSHGDGEESLMF